MAQRELNIIARVRDQATGQLRTVQKSLKDTGTAAAQSGVDFTKFNRIMFSTTAFIGMFQKAFSSLTNTLMQAGELDRVSTAFENTFGTSKGVLFDAIKGFTSNSIDRVEAMRSAISLKTLGIAEDTGQIGELIARAGTAAKMAGYTSEEGIRRVTQSLKDGSLGSLEFLNQIRSGSPALKTLFSVMQHGTGVMGSALTAQMRFNLIFNALKGITLSTSAANRDLYDRLLDVRQAFTFLRTSIGRFLGEALGSVLDKLVLAADAVSKFIDRMRGMGQPVLDAAKNFLLVGGAIAGVVASIGTLRLLALALGSVGLGGFPALTLLLFGSAAAFMDVGAATQKVTNLFKLFGAAIAGVYQLVSTFLMDSKNFENGIGKIDTRLADFLRANHIYGIVLNIARLSAAILSFVRDVGRQFIDFFRGLTIVLSPVTKLLNMLFSGDPKKGWFSGLFKEGSFLRKMLVDITALLVGFYAVKKVGGLAGGLLSHLPVVGKLFGGLAGKSPKGTPTDPIYTRSMEAIASGAISMGSTIGTIAGPIMAIAIAGAIGVAIGDLINHFAPPGSPNDITTLATQPLIDNPTNRRMNLLSSNAALAATQLMQHQGVPNASQGMEGGAKFIQNFGNTPEDIKRGSEELSRYTTLAGTKEQLKLPQYPSESPSEASSLIQGDIESLKSIGLTTQADLISDALNKFAKDHIITREEWTKILSSGINQSKVSKHQPKEPEHKHLATKKC